MSAEPAAKTHEFQAEVRQLLHLMIHSLYSNKEIFLRELISNASDAADRLRFESLGDASILEDEPDLHIKVICDPEGKKLTILDNGIGMSRDGIIENLGTIARSGTAEFLGRMTGDQARDAQLIGQFGVGFYSAFIVAERVVVESRAAGEAGGVRWTSEGEGEFTIEDIELAARGTSVTLHLKADESEFCEPLRVETLIRKYSDHIGFPVFLEVVGNDEEAKTVNSATALWTRPRTEIGDDEYKEFYKHLSHDYSDPVAWSHNRVEGKREYTSLLYVPARAPFDLWNRDAPRGVKLYVQRVFIMDDAEQFLPLYLRFVKGVVDSADLPLNVSRELLQKNHELDAMRTALTRRVLDMLRKIAAAPAKEDEESDSESVAYPDIWREFGAVLKEGLVEDPANADKLLPLLRFATSAGDSAAQDQSLDDYLARAAEEQGKIYYLLCDTHATGAASPHLEKLREKGIEVLLLSDKIDPWIVAHLPEYEGKAFVDVTRADLGLPDGEGELTQDAMNEEYKPLLKKMRQALKDRVESVNASRRLVDSAARVVAGDQDIPLQMRQMLEASGQTLPESRPVLEVNMEHPLLQRLSAETDGDRFADLSEIVLDHAMLAEGTQLSDPADYLQRMNRLLTTMDE